MKDEIISVVRELLDERKEKRIISEEEKIRAAYALNMCMVSVSQIIDYDDLYILDQEYDGILNNLNLEMMPKDEALLSIIKQLLDTITFFRIQDGDKKLLEQEYQQKMKNAIWNAVPNFSFVIAGGSPTNIAVSLASQIGIGYMNYRRTKAESAFEYEKQLWKLQRSAMEQFNGLRRELFDTAWRLADTYQFPDEYRLTERQIKQYNEVLMDPDEIRKYERLSTISQYFVAYPPFWYHYGSTANHISRNMMLPLSEESRQYYREQARQHFDKYWKQNKFALLREDLLASSCALEYADLLKCDTDREEIEQLLDRAVKYSGNANDVLQLCAMAYLKINERNKASEIFRILVNENYNIVVNAQILSGLYVHKVIAFNDLDARIKYETLSNRINSEYLYKMPLLGEHINEEHIKNEFAERQEALLLNKFNAVIRYYSSDFSVRLGKIIPPTNPQRKYPDYYFSEEGMGQRIKDFQELFASSFKQKKRMEYLNFLSQNGFVNAFFEEINKFFGEITELNCIRDRQKLQETISKKIVNKSALINELEKKIEEKKIVADDMILLLEFTSLGFFKEFIDELEAQIELTVLGMNDMAKFAIADSKLCVFCAEHNIPEPDELLSDGREAKSDAELVTNYFSVELLKSEEKREIETSKYRQIEAVIKNNIDVLKSISAKCHVYFHDSTDFNSYFESSKLKKHKDILQKTIAVFDDKGMQNVDVLFTEDGLVPVIRNGIKTPIPYFAIASDTKKKVLEETLKSVIGSDMKMVGGLSMALAVLPGLGKLATAGTVAFDTRMINHIINVVQPMIDEICNVIILGLEQEL